jgi:hypothetical protein
MMGICSIQRQYLSRIGACILDTDLVLLVLLGLVGESKFERLPHVEIGHVGIVFGVVVDFATELLLLLAGWDTSIGYIAFHGGVGFAIVGYGFQECRTSGSGSDTLGQHSPSILFGILLTVPKQASSRRL